MKDADDVEVKPSSGRGRPKKHTDDRPRQERVTAKSRKTDRTAHGQSGFKSSKKKAVDEMGYGASHGQEEVTEKIVENNADLTKKTSKSLKEQAKKAIFSKIKQTVFDETRKKYQGFQNIFYTQHTFKIGRASCRERV